MTQYDPAAVAQHTHQAWERAAPTYAETVGFLTAASGQIELLIEAAGIGRGTHLLDVGCGPGLLSRRLAAVGARVVGIDFAEGMIAEARKRNPEIEFHLADVESLPFADAFFEVSVCNYTAHHFARPEVAFAELRRVLEPGGVVAIVHPIQSRQPSWGSFADACAAVLPPEQVPSGPLFDLSRPQDLVDLLSRVGFVDCHAETRVKPVALRSLDLLLDAAWKIAGLDSQPHSVQDEIRAGTIARAAPHRQADGSYLFRDEVLLSRARR